MTPPLFSIITVTYNSATTLARTMTSLKQQSLQNFEYIVVDGASTDQTVSVAESFKPFFGDRLTIISERDRGMYDAMNKGIQKASGQLIGILNADDWYEPTALADVAATFAAHPSSGVYYGILRAVDEQERELKCVRAHHRFLGKEMIPHPTSFVKRDIYVQHGLYSLDYKLAADFEMMMRLSQSGVVFQPVDRVLTNFTRGGASTKQKRRLKLETLKIRKQYGLLSRLDAMKLFVLKLMSHI